MQSERWNEYPIRTATQSRNRSTRYRRSLRQHRRRELCCYLNPCIEHLENRHLLAVDLLSVTPDGLFAGSDDLPADVATSKNPAISGNGKFVVFQSKASDLTPPLGMTTPADSNDAEDVFVRDLETGITTLISVNSDGTDSGSGETFRGASYNPAISDDGRFIAFVSFAEDLVKEVVESVPNVFVRDLDVDGDGIFNEPGDSQTRLLSIATDGTAAGLSGADGVGTSAEMRPVISPNGDFVAFGSAASDLAISQTLPGGAPIPDGNGGFDVFIAATDGTTLDLVTINRDDTAATVNALGTASANPSLSFNGSQIAFQSNGFDLVDTVPDSVLEWTRNVFVNDGGKNTLVSINSVGDNGGNGESAVPVISRDGRHVAFITKATDLVTGIADPNGLSADIYVRDLLTDTTTLVSRSGVIADSTGNDDSPPSFDIRKPFVSGPSISANGRYIAFASLASDLLDPDDGMVDENAGPDIFVLDRDVDMDGLFDEPGEMKMHLVSVNEAGTASGDGGLFGSSNPTISGNGRYVAFSTDDELIDGVTGMKVYVRDLIAETTYLISPADGASGGGPAAGTSGDANVVISNFTDRVGRAAYVSLSSELDPDVSDTNGTIDVYAFTPPTDIVMGRNFATGFSDFIQSFRVLHQDASEFELGYYRSLDDRLDATDELLGVTPITDPDDLTVDGNRIITTTIGVDAGSVPFPGIDGETDPMEDYFILTVADHLDVVSEFDGDPLNEDNTRTLRGSYQLPGTPVFAHGIARDETFTVDVIGQSVRLSYGITGIGTPSVVTYDLDEGLEIHLRTHGGNDTVIGSDLKELVFGGEGGDSIRGEGGDDMLSGGPGNDRIDGGEGADTIDGGEGSDTLIGGPGADIIFDGPGDDTIDVGLGDDTVFATPGSDDVFLDSGGNDTLDFSFALHPITIDLDSAAVQTVDSAGNTIRLIGQWENFVGDPLDDDSTVYVKPLDVPRVIDGGGGVDRLILDALGANVVDDGTTFSFPGTSLADISYVGFEQIRVINAAANVIDDGDPGYIANGFTRQFDPLFLQGFNGDIEFSAANAGNVATWTFTDIPPGHFAVSATWTSAPDRGENVRFVVHDGDSSGPVVADVNVNQEIAPSEFDVQGISFQNLAIVPITGHTLTVELFDLDADLDDDDPDSFVIADAVRIEPISETRIIDDGETEFSSSGIHNQGIGAFGDITTTQATGTTSAGVWDCTGAECSSLLPPGPYLVSATWPSLALGASPEATFIVNSGVNSFTTNVNQILSPNDFNDIGIDWERLGVIEVAEGDGIRTELTSDAGLLLADAIRFDPAPQVTVRDSSGDEVANGATWNLGQTVIDSDAGTTLITDHITIENSGIADLIISNLQISGSGYSIVDAGADVLRPGGTTQVGITLQASSLGTFEGQLTLRLNDFSDDRFGSIDLTSEVIEDTTPPTVAITSPFSGVTFIEGSTIPIAVDATDDIKIKAVELRVDGDFIESDDTFPFHFDFTLPADVPNVELTAQAIDVAGNQTDSAPITVNLSEDQPPTVNITQPIDGQGIIAGSPLRIAIDVEDDVQVESVSLFLNSQLIGFEVLDPFVFDFEFPSLPAGLHSIETLVFDTAGNLSTDAIDLNVFSPPAIHFGSIVVGSESGAPPVVKVFEPDGTETFSFFPYSPTFTGGVRVATGDVNGDGTPDIITGAGPGGGPHVKVFDGTSGATLHSFFAYEPQFTGGVFVASGDVTGDGIADVITGAGPGGGPHVKVFSGSDGAELASFFAFNNSFSGGVRVATGDVNGDAQDDIIVGAGPGGGPHVRVFDGHTANQLPTTGVVPADQILSDFFAFDQGFVGGVFVASADLNGDRLDDIVVGADQAGSNNGGHVKVIDSASLPSLDANIQIPDSRLLAHFFAYGPDFAGGVRVAAGDVNGDGVADIVTSPGVDDPLEATVKVFDGSDLSTINDIELGPGFLGSAVAVADQPIALVVNFHPGSPQHEVDVDTSGVTVRDQNGNVVFFQPATDPSSLIRLNGSPNSNDLLVFRGIGIPPIGPFVFDGGIGGNDALRIETQSASDPPLEFLKTKLQSSLVTSFFTDRNADDLAFALKAIDLEPIEDTLDVIDREFEFADTDDNVMFNTGDDPNDSVLRIDSDNSEVIDFRQPSGTTHVQLGGGSDVFTFDLSVDQLPTVDGGQGVDTFVLAGSGHHLDLTDPIQNKPLNLERIDVIGASPNELTIDGPSVMAATDENHVLVVAHDEDDTVNYAGDGWQVMAPTFADGGQRHVLVNGDATVETVNTKPWQNPFAATDVDHSGATTAFDALQIINLLNRFRTTAVVLNTPTDATTLANRYYDVNGMLNNDGQYVASAADAIDVINFLNINKPPLIETTQPSQPPQPEAATPNFISTNPNTTDDEQNEAPQVADIQTETQQKLQLDIGNLATSSIVPEPSSQINNPESTSGVSDLDSRDRALTELFLSTEIE
ncbi:hemolysin-type calcium-binding region domain protein [Rhodopirellula maiorica SM1]|uniref:Hemolysin-type calcium-binding region domain protein n=2 Tax=Novipirellula TaxID=2795426 RepID=M5RJJ3_9BACT|nr:hemolysin-type calcium-binding region domain protein [Rhodopirellula maiorica SM1]